MQKNGKFLGLCFVVGVSIFGYILFVTSMGFKSRPKVVVKGIGERVVEADYAVWKISFKTRGESFPQARTAYNVSLKKVKEFLLSQGIKDTEISINVPTVTFQDHTHEGDNKQNVEYNIQSDIVIKSGDVKRIQSASGKTYELLEKDVFLVTDYGANPKYLLRDFDSVRPELLQEAVTSAKKMAEKFAEHSGTTVGDISHANQGSFSVQSVLGDYNEEAYPQKKVRVVSHVTYVLG